MPRFIICKASAGSGKTYTLVRQYIEIAIASPSRLETGFEHILAITFTNKAASGMKARIMKRLRLIIMEDPDSQDLIDEMSKHLGISHDETVRRCTVLQSAILHNYSSFAVCTIDSFVHRIVRTFAHDLNLPMNFNLLIDNAEVVQTSVDELLSLAGTDKEKALTRVLCSFTESKMINGTGYEVSKQIKDLTKEIFKEESPAFLSKLKDISTDHFIDTHERLSKANVAFETKLKTAASAFVDACVKADLGVNDFPNKDKGIYPFFLSLAKGDYSKVNSDHKRVKECYAKGNILAKNTPPAVRPRLESVTPDFMKAYGIIGPLLSSELRNYNTRRILLANLYCLALLDKINKIKNLFYSENESVHISEFNKRIAAEIVNEPTPFIYERIGSRYTNYLIDEFQDTSKLQWENFLPLLDEAMTHRFSADTAEPGTQSLVVGDGKQAIYRFRQGDVRQFINLPKVRDGIHGKSLQFNYHIDTLDCNYRTLETVVEFNNNLFNHIIRNSFADNEYLANLYLGDETIQQDPEARPDLWQDSQEKGGFVSVSFPGKADEVYDAVMREIRHQVDDLGYNYGDIMVLARKNDILSDLSRYLSVNSVPGKEIPIESSESFILSTSRTVRLLQALLKYIFNPSDRVAALQVMQLLPVPTDVWMLKEDRYDLAKLLGRLGVNFNIDYLRSLSLYDCCETLLRLFSLQGRDTAYVATFLNAVAKYCERGNADLGGFIDYFDKNIDNLSSSTVSDSNAVKFMSIHKAKGLESRIVIYAMVGEVQSGSSLWVDVDKSSEFGVPVAFVRTNSCDSEFSDVFREEALMSDMDRINVFYVAMTRPEEKLVVIGENKYKSGGVDEWSLLHNFVSHYDKASKDTPVAYERYTVGVDAPNTAKPKSPSQPLMVSSVSYPSWTDRIDIASKNEALLSSVDEDSRRYGILIHDLLSRIMTIDDVHDVVDGYCSSHDLTSETEVIENRIKRMIEANNRFFDKGARVLCETSLFFGGEVLRPDRLVFFDDETWVVDFKSGVYNALTHAKYEEKVSQYVDAVKAMGYPNVKSAILYL